MSETPGNLTVPKKEVNFLKRVNFSPKRPTTLKILGMKP